MRASRSTNYQNKIKQKQNKKNSKPRNQITATKRQDKNNKADQSKNGKTHNLVNNFISQS